MKKRIFKHWISTIAGLTLAIINMLAGTNPTKKDVAITAGIVILGALSKDKSLLEPKEDEENEK